MPYYHGGAGHHEPVHDRGEQEQEVSWRDVAVGGGDVGQVLPRQGTRPDCEDEDAPEHHPLDDVQQPLL
jgi:hypothetical protein